MKIIHVVIIYVVVGLLYAAFALSVGESYVVAMAIFFAPAAVALVGIVLNRVWLAFRPKYRDRQLKRRNRDR